MSLVGDVDGRVGDGERSHDLVLERAGEHVVGEQDEQRVVEGRMWQAQLAAQLHEHEYGAVAALKALVGVHVEEVHLRRLDALQVVAVRYGPAHAHLPRKIVVFRILIVNNHKSEKRPAKKYT